MEFELRLPREWESDFPIPIDKVDMELLGAMIFLGIPLDKSELKALDATTDNVLLVWTSLLGPDMSAKSADVRMAQSPLLASSTGLEQFLTTSAFSEIDPSSNLLKSKPMESLEKE